MPLSASRVIGFHGLLSTARLRRYHLYTRAETALLPGGVFVDKAIKYFFTTILRKPLHTLLECLDHSPAGSLHPSLQAAVILWIAAAIALLLCLLVSPILDSSLWAMEYLFHGSHTHRSICFLSFLRCTHLRYFIYNCIFLFFYKFCAIEQSTTWSRAFPPFSRIVSKNFTSNNHRASVASPLTLISLYLTQ